MPLYRSYLSSVIPNVSFFLCLLFSFQSGAANVADKLDGIVGENILTNEKMTIPGIQSDGRALAVIFLSAACPCSNNHIGELKRLSEKFPKIRFVGVHSNFNESKEMSRDYFKEKKLGFTVIQDVESKMADTLKAFKTPHAFLFNSKAELVYQGGVTDSSDVAKAKTHFLENAIDDLTANREVKVALGRTLGCVILRENEKNVW